MDPSFFVWIIFFFRRGNNFKGFDFRGIGPVSNEIYLGGNQFFTSTIGYGSSFLFDEKSNGYCVK